ncbi:hypothetical protein SeMB42_g05956 [Synchytrium endobioticum]|uniref:Uncharacterized protein n=1 Tax=Synchytrium endobioticum TaxID=286115 RepID=A0A507CN39_9FUNG|nr:hypothetical protein SeMB42_g05956 [Synchytrium endobioticum]
MDLELQVLEVLQVDPLVDVCVSETALGDDESQKKYVTLLFMIGVSRGSFPDRRLEAWVDVSLEDDSSSPPPPVQVFYKINRLLPAPYRWSIVPHTSFGDGYVTMSEECLFDLLFDIPSFQKTVREVAGVGPKIGKTATRTEESRIYNYGC